MPIQYFDRAAETMPREQLPPVQLQRLRELLRVVLDSNPFYKQKLFEAGIRSAEDIRTLEDFCRVPLTTKSELVADQTANPIFGTNLSFPLDHFVKYHQTSGTTGRPLRWLDTEPSWQWWLRCWGAVYKSAGVGAGDRVFFAFGFGPFIGFWSAFESARLVGAMTIAGGGMSTEQRLQAIMDSQATVLVCTPTYALHLAGVAQREGLDLARSAIRVTIQAGEPGGSIASVRQRIEESWGAQCFDHTGATEVGATGFSCLARSGVHMNEGEFVFEVVDPVTLEIARRGELVVTNLGRHGMPVIRYRLGDVVQWDDSPCDCGRSYARLVGGVIGRVDDMVTVRGVNVFPSAIDSIVREFAGIREYCAEVKREGALDELVLSIEVPDAASSNVAVALLNQVQRQLSLRPVVRIVSDGTLPRFELKARRFFDRRRA